jgi:uncharacterized membrane protein YdjX (TVP38/TMEM64 family)
MIAAAVVASRWLPIARWVEGLVEWTRHAGVVGVAAFALVFVAFALAMLPTIELYIAAGLVYGTVWGTVWSSAVTLVSAMLAYVIARTSVRSWIESRLRQHEKLARLDRELGAHSFWIAVLVRLAPILPFGPTNYALAASQTTTARYAASTLAGTLPTSFMYAYAGSLLHGASELHHTRPGQAVLWWLGVAMTIAAGIAIGWIAKRALARMC